jgi:hypothetical protein
MALLSKAEGGSGFDPVPEGSHAAACINVVDMGIQDTPWGRKEKVYLGFEIPDVRVTWTDKDGKEHEGPAFVGATYTNSIHEKSNLGQHLVSWRGKAFTQDEKDGFDLFNILGAPCLLSIQHHTNDAGRTFARIGSIMRMPAGMHAPQVESELIAYTPADNEKIGNLKKLPEWLQEKCRAGFGPAADYPVNPTETLPPMPPAEPDEGDGIGGGFNDDIPF